MPKKIIRKITNPLKLQNQKKVPRGISSDNSDWEREEERLKRELPPKLRRFNKT